MIRSAFRRAGPRHWRVRAYPDVSSVGAASDRSIDLGARVVYTPCWIPQRTYGTPRPHFFSCAESPAPPRESVRRICLCRFGHNHPLRTDPLFCIRLCEQATYIRLYSTFLCLSSGQTHTSNTSPPPLMVAMTPFGYMAPRSKGMSVLQMYIEFLH